MIRALLLFLLLPAIGNAEIFVISSSTAPAGTEAELVAQTTTYFDATVTTNPLFAGASLITLYGPKTSQFQIITDSGTYAFIYGKGIEDQRDVDLNLLLGENNSGAMNNSCMQSPQCVGISSMTVPSDFTIGNSTYTVQIDSTTCFAIMCNLASQIYLQGPP